MTAHDEFVDRLYAVIAQSDDLARDSSLSSDDAFRLAARCGTAATLLRHAATRLEAHGRAVVFARVDPDDETVHVETLERES
jgi:hypothetical protein